MDQSFGRPSFPSLPDEAVMGVPDWTDRNAYAWTKNLTLREWAWEFLRRNPDFQAAWQTARLEYGIAGYYAQTMMVMSQHQVPNLSSWGCLYCSSPAQDSREAAVFWSPDLCPGVLRLSAFSLTEKIEATPFLLREIVSPSILLEMPAGPQHMLFREGGYGLQLLIHGADVTKAVRLVADGAPNHALAKPQLRSLRCFNDLRLAGRLRPSHIQRDLLSARWGVVLQALDASLAGASQKEIARCLFAYYSEEGWRSPDRSLRFRLRNAVRRGYMLMRRGYRSLLS
jgi:hypothetical protein